MNPPTKEQCLREAAHVLVLAAERIGRERAEQREAA